MKLKYHEKTFRVVDSKDLSSLISSNYDTQFSVSLSEGWENNSYHLLEVRKGDLNPSEQMKVDEIGMGFKRNSSLGTIIKDMCNNDIVEEGDYMVKVSWR